MLVVLASRHDPAAREFVRNLGGDAGLLTCQDLSARGWWYQPGRPDGTSVIGGRLVSTRQIDGVLSRLPAVDETELADIIPGDRSYVAAEMTAFLAAWLTDLRCPVLNRPTAVCLTGPSWRQEKWIHIAAKLGIPVRPARRRVPAYQRQDLAARSATITVIGRRCLGDPKLFGAARALAEDAGVGLLRARFASAEGHSAFLGADYLVDINDPGIAEAIRQYFADADMRSLAGDRGQ